MAYLKGHSVIAKLGSLAEQTALASTSSTLSLTANTEDVTTKEDVVDGVLYSNEEVTYNSGVLTVEGYEKTDTDVLGTMDIGDEVACDFTTGKRKYSFTGLIKELEFTGDKDSTAGYSITINSKGAITMTAVS